MGTCMTVGASLVLYSTNLTLGGHYISTLLLGTVAMVTYKALQNLVAMVTYKALQNLAKDHVSSIEPGGLDGGDEELGAIGVLASISHAQVTWPLVLQLEVLIWKLVAIDTFTCESYQIR